MSLPTDQLLTTLAMAQLSMVVPVLEGTYAGGTAATIGLGVLVLAKDALTYETRRAQAAEAAGAILAQAGADVPEGHDGRMAALDRLLAATNDPGTERRILDLYVAMSEAALLPAPALPA